MNNRFKYLFFALIVAAMTVLPESLMAQERAVKDSVKQQRYQVGVCDWMILKRQKLGEFKLAHEIGADGVEMDMGGLGKRDSFDNKMRLADHVKNFRHHADSFNIKIGAVAMSGFYGQSFATKKSYRWLVQDCLNTMEKMGAKVAFLPLGGCGSNWADSLPLRKVVVERLREVGNMAAQRGMVIGIDTHLSAQENIRLLNEVKSRGIQIFFKFQTAIENKRDIIKELRMLGRSRICAIHASNTDGSWIKDDPAIDMPKIKYTLDRMGWSGWLYVERSRNEAVMKDPKYNHGERVKINYSTNVKYLKEILQKK